MATEGAGTDPYRVPRAGHARHARTSHPQARVTLALCLRVALVALPLALGLVVRLWFIAHTPINSDFSVPGLMANAILHGHLNAFYWGQDYGGVEPFVVAFSFLLFGHNAYAIAAVPAALSAVSAVLVWRIARRLVPDPYLAMLAGALAWAAPEIAMWNATREYGFRGVTTVAGLAAILFALRVLDRRHRYLDLIGLGLAIGIGWWASPEIVYFALPAALLLIGAIISRPGGLWHWPPRLLVTVCAAALAAVPWLWPNVSDGFLSLQASSFGGSKSTQYLPYGARLALEFQHSFPVGLGTQALGGNGVLASPWSTVAWGVALAVLALSILLALTRPGRSQAIGLGVAAFPFLYAVSPATWFWQDGRYVVYLPPLLALVLVIGCTEAPRRWLDVRRWATGHRDDAAAAPDGRGADAPVGRGDNAPAAQRRWARRGGLVCMSAVVVACTLLAGVVFAQQYQVQANTTQAFTSGWTQDPNAPAAQAANLLERAGVHRAYADYWVAYKEDLLADGRLIVTPAPQLDVVRSETMANEVQAAPHAAWLFVPPAQMTTGYQQFGSSDVIRGPATVPMSKFVEYLDTNHIPYHVVHADLLTAIVPARKVTPYQVVASGILGH